MAAPSKDKKTLSAASVREMTDAKRGELLAEKRTELHDAQRSLKAGELANLGKLKSLRREIALILTVENEPADSGRNKEEKK